jgi:methionine-rich copper-binding protein CopC
MRPRFLVLAGALLGLLIVSTPVSAHSDLRTSVPVDGQTIRRPASRIVLIFWSPVSDAMIQLTGPDGHPVEGQTRQIDELTVNFETDPVTHEGSYRVSFELLARDGDPATGEISFIYAPDAAPGIAFRTISMAAAVLIIAVVVVARIKRRRR